MDQRENKKMHYKMTVPLQLAIHSNNIMITIIENLK